MDADTHSQLPWRAMLGPLQADLHAHQLSVCSCRMCDTRCSWCVRLVCAWCVGLARLISTPVHHAASMCACLTLPVLPRPTGALLRCGLTRFDFEGVDVQALFAEFQETEKRLKELKEKGGIQRQVRVVVFAIAMTGRGLWLCLLAC